MPQLERRMFATVRHKIVEFHVCVIGELGAIEFHFWGQPDSLDPGCPFTSLGVESHRRCQKPDANRDTCFVLGGDPCYHDGTSLWAREYVMPLFLEGGCEAVYPALERKYRGDFERRDED